MQAVSPINADELSTGALDTHGDIPVIIVLIANIADAVDK